MVYFINVSVNQLEHSLQVARFLKSVDALEDLVTILSALLTPAELESLSQRLSILDGLSAGVAQREIADTLRVGIATVTRGSRVWQENRPILTKYFPRNSDDKLLSHGHVSEALLATQQGETASKQVTQRAQVTRPLGTALPEL